VKLEYLQKLKFLQSMVLFKGWNEQEMTTILGHMIVKTYARGNTIYDYGDSDKNIHIVIEGSLEMSQRYDSIVERAEGGDQKKTNMDGNNLMSRTAGKYSHKPKDIPVRVLDRGSWFGDEEGLCQNVKQFKVRVSTSSAKLYVIPRSKIRMNARSTRHLRG
jgi:CRP-like cAMP-binding protein